MSENIEELRKIAYLWETIIVKDQLTARELLQRLKRIITKIEKEDE